MLGGKLFAVPVVVLELMILTLVNSDKHVA